MFGVLMRVRLPTIWSPFLSSMRHIEARRIEQARAARRGFGVADITPTFSRSWLMNTATVLDLETMPPACAAPRHQPRLRATYDWPISPSISALGISAATESMT